MCGSGARRSFAANHANGRERADKPSLAEINQNWLARVGVRACPFRDSVRRQPHDGRIDDA
jgi:hypothetical protein